MRSIILAFSSKDATGRIRDVLTRHGLPVRAKVSSGSAVLRQALACPGGGLVICSPRFGDMTARQLFALLSDDFDVLVLCDTINAFIPEPGFYVLAPPIICDELIICARMLFETRQMSPTIEQKSPKDCENLPIERKGETRERQDIAAAKLCLIKKEHLSEEEAHRFLQKESMRRGIKKAQLATEILERHKEQKA